MQLSGPPTWKAFLSHHHPIILNSIVLFHNSIMFISGLIGTKAKWVIVSLFFEQYASGVAWGWLVISLMWFTLLKLYKNKKTILQIF